MGRTTVIPRMRLLEAGRQRGERPYAAVRPEGTEEWVLILTEKGDAEFRFPGGKVRPAPGQVLLMAPGAPQNYGGRNGWRNVWVHFFPRPDCLTWMRWPAVAPGLFSLHLEGTAFAEVRRALQQVVAYAQVPAPRTHELAVNALERALLLCDAANPLAAPAQQDARVRRAVAMIYRHPERSFRLADLARASGSSRSHFLSVFQKEMGMTPRCLLERHRLRRARQLLAYTSLTLEAIADEIGFSSPFYLSLRFKKQFGVSPKIFRARTRAKKRNASRDLSERRWDQNRDFLSRG